MGRLADIELGFVVGAQLVGNRKDPRTDTIFVQRSRFLCQLEVARITPSELHQRLAAPENYEHLRLLASSERILVRLD